MMQSLWCSGIIDSKTERSVTTWREERRLEGQATQKTDISISSFIRPLSVFLSPPSFSRSPSVLFLPPALDLVLDLFSSTLSLHLFFSRLLSLGFAAMVTTSSLHEVHLCPRDGSEGIGGSQDRLVVHDRLRGHHGNAPHLMTHLRREHSIHRHLGCRHRKSHWCWSIASIDHPIHLRDGHGCRCHGMGGVSPVGAGAHGL